MEEWSAEINGMMKDGLISSTEFGDLKGEIIRIKGLLKDMNKIAKNEKIEQSLEDSVDESLGKDLNESIDEDLNDLFDDLDNF